MLSHHIQDSLDKCGVVMGFKLTWKTHYIGEQAH